MLDDTRYDALNDLAPSSRNELRAKTQLKTQATKKRRPGFIERTVNAWFSRLVGAAAGGSAGELEEKYASNRTSKDYLWNSIGFATWGFVFPILTVVVTQFVNVEQAGMFSMAFVVGTLLMIIANYGTRTYQVSDIQETHSFLDYQINRWITCIAMLGLGVLYCLIRGYIDEMLTISVGVYLYRMVDALADVYEGRLQQVDKLYLAGISQTIRSLIVIIAFTLTLSITGNVAISCIVMTISAAASFIVITLPLALLETPRTHRFNFASVGELFKQSFPLFIALFLYALIDNMPKFVMEGALGYDNQLYFNALYFPAQGILITVGLIYRPLLVRMAALWTSATEQQVLASEHNTDERITRSRGTKRSGKNKRSPGQIKFDLVTLAILAAVILFTAGMALLMNLVGLPAMSFLYGVDFEQFSGLCLIMVITGGITSAIDFLYQVITVLRKQSSALRPYLITFGFSLFIPILLVNFTGLPGAVIGYLIVMSILFVLLVWEYLRIRFSFKHQIYRPNRATSYKKPL